MSTLVFTIVIFFKVLNKQLKYVVMTINYKVKYVEAKPADHSINFGSYHSLGLL